MENLYFTAATSARDLLHTRCHQRETHRNDSACKSQSTVESRAGDQIRWNLEFLVGSTFTRYVLAPGRLTRLGNNAIPCTYSGLHLHVFLPSLTFSSSTTTTTTTTSSLYLRSCADHSAHAEQMDAPHATITILDVSLSLVHIPRSRVADLTRPILKQLLRLVDQCEISVFMHIFYLQYF